MASRIDFQRVVAERSRGIADRARRVEPASSPSESAPAPEAPAWLRRAVELLPERARTALRAALGDAGLLAQAHRAREDAQRAIEQLRRDREDLRHREKLLDDARGDLEQARRQLEARRLEVVARESESERDRAELQRLAEAQAVERRVPLAEILAGAPPRPLRDVARLAANIKRFGQLQPITVTPEGERLRLVTGFRRLAALRHAGLTHAVVRVVPHLDAEAAAALHVAENCLVTGVSPNAVKHLAARLGDAPGFDRVLPQVLADDEGTVEDAFLEDLAEDARHHLAEGASFVATLRPHWAELDAAQRQAIEQLLAYFARVAARLGR